MAEPGAVTCLFAIELNKWNSHKVCSENHRCCGDGGENEMPVTFHSICTVISADFLRVESVRSSNEYKEIFPVVVSRGAIFRRKVNE